jgi:hypothetical protein
MGIGSNGGNGMNDIIKVYETVTGNKNLKQGRVAITSEIIIDYEKLHDDIALLNPEQGWLCYQSEVVTVERGTVPERADKILYGELVDGSKSFHVHQQDEGWLITTIDEEAGDSCLFMEKSYHVSGKEKSNYHVYWEKTDSGYQPKGYRFVGFSKIEGESS